MLIKLEFNILITFLKKVPNNNNNNHFRTDQMYIFKSNIIEESQ